MALTGEITYPGHNYRTRKTLESWNAAIMTNSDNNSKPLPKQYATLVRKICNRELLPNAFGLAFQHTCSL